ncbi:MAG: DNA translocase FtsK [Thermodesulfobacteria bacterium]|nr:DNA translocase FtsK [Thermodesulfobacteriota bacterium]
MSNETAAQKSNINSPFLIKEIGVIVLFGLIVFVFASLLSYTPTDPSLSHLGAHEVKNWMGPAGAAFADLLFSLFGLASWLLVLLLVGCLIFLLKGPIFDKRMFHLLSGGVLILLSSCILFWLWEPHQIKGGIVGAALAQSLRDLFGTAGAALFGTMLLMIGLVLATPLSLTTQLQRVAGLIFKKGQGDERDDQQEDEGARPPKAVKKAEKKKAEDEKPNIVEPVITHKQKAQPPEEPPAEEKEFQITPVKGNFVCPPLSFLQDPPQEEIEIDKEAYIENSKVLEQKLKDFGVSGKVVEICPGPVVTMYEFSPAPGVKINKVASLADDLALALKTRSVRIVAPIPGKAVIGIELANPKRQTVYLKQILSSDAFKKGKGELLLALGQDIVGQPVVTDLARMPHLLIAGATGTGKSVGLNSMICSLLYRLGPDTLRLLMIDPKRIELSLYDGIPHLIHPVVSEPKEATRALKWAVMEMERRYQLLEEAHARNIAGYNKQADEPLPYLVVIIDELADLMMVSSKEVEASIARLAQMARAAGMHIIIATQRPSVDVLTGLIKANFPARISFKVSSKVDSRTILDTMGAERLLGNGDMLFLPPGTSNLERIHGAYISESEILKIVEFLKAQGEPDYDFSVVEPSPDEQDAGGSDGGGEFYDEKYDEAVEIVTSTGQASISGLQRRLRVGYNRAARMIEQMERDGIVTPTDGMGRRQVIARGYDDV